MVSTVEGVWLRTDEPSDVRDSLLHTLRLLDFVETDKAVWKWVILAAHSAVQGSMVCHLSGSSQLGCLSSKSAIAWLDWHDKDRRGEINWIDNGTNDLGLPSRYPATKADRPPRQYLAKPDELFVRLYDNSVRVEQGCGGVLEITDAQKTSIKRLTELRNDFTHFSPKGWSIELNGLPRIVLGSIIVCKTISADEYPFRHLDPGRLPVVSQLLGSGLIDHNQ